jgi:hypothetical protein
MPPVFFTENTIIIKVTHIMGTSFTHLRLFLHKVFIIDALTPPMYEILCVSRINSLVEASKVFTPTVFQIVVFRKAASSECILQESKKMEVGG